MRDKKTMEKMHQNFVQSGFTIESWTDVTENVVDALDIIDEGRREMIRQSAPPSPEKLRDLRGCPALLFTGP